MNTDKILITAIIAFGIATGALLSGGGTNHSSWKAGLLPFGAAAAVGDPMADRNALLQLPDSYHQLLGM